MNFNRAPLIKAGQLFLHEGLNEYLIVTQNKRGQVYYEGPGFNGSCEDYTFIERFPAVDPADVDQDELDTLINFCPPGTEASIGFVGE